MGQHEIESRALELTVKDQVRVGNDDRAIGHMAMRLRGEGIDMAIDVRAGTLAIQGDRGVKFASVIQPRTAKRVKI